MITKELAISTANMVRSLYPLLNNPNDIIKSAIQDGVLSELDEKNNKAVWGRLVAILNRENQ
jgi:hypothetical protein